jgi:predicted O-methyltransferase YrrM
VATMRSTIKPFVPMRLRRALRDFEVPGLPRAIRDSARVARRRAFAMSYYNDTIALIERWAVARSEESNFLYAITEKSRTELAHLLGCLFGGSPSLYRSYFREVDDDVSFRRHIEGGLKSVLPDVSSIDVGRRLGWYAIARRIRPEIIIETGVDYGLGSCLLCAALLRNRQEGFPGRYIGTDINPNAGLLLKAPYDEVGSIVYGDSIDTLSRMTESIDLFINDSDHSAAYEAQEYDVIRPRLGPRAVLLGDNSHATTALADFSEAHGRRFAFFKEQPRMHWYPGAGIGISFSQLNEGMAVRNAGG